MTLLRSTHSTKYTHQTITVIILTHKHALWQKRLTFTTSFWERCSQKQLHSGTQLVKNITQHTMQTTNETAQLDSSTKLTSMQCRQLSNSVNYIICEIKTAGKKFLKPRILLFCAWYLYYMHLHYYYLLIIFFKFSFYPIFYCLLFSFLFLFTNYCPK